MRKAVYGPSHIPVSWSAKKAGGSHACFFRTNESMGVFMYVIGIAANVLLWLLVLFLAVLVLGTLRAVERVRWRLQQLEATTPSRLGRRGLQPGTKAPDFSLPRIQGGKLSLSSFAGRKVLLVFTQSGCGPCRQIVPELNDLHEEGDVAVLVVNNGDLDTTTKWARELAACFPVVVQETFQLSRRYEVFATPFAFLINEQGVIGSKGIITERQHIDFVLSGVGAEPASGPAETELSLADGKT
jgi:methylamine dehydrogenase accessory protein MauD